MAYVPPAEMVYGMSLRIKPLRDLFFTQNFYKNPGNIIDKHKQFIRRSITNKKKFMLKNLDLFVRSDNV